MRLSREDEDATNESASIQTQRKMLRSYANENSFFVYDEYIDDGWSGTNFDRPGFQKMIHDIESGYVNMVITKDLSRLGRDYITAGQYTEMYFPEHQVRYIAINDGYDSLNPFNDIAPFKHVINEMYARDTSKKIRSAITTKMKEGNFIGNFPPYGYAKDPQNKNHLVIDYEVAPVVREMFAMAEHGYRPGEIAKIFNDRKIATPAVYRCMKHPNLNIENYSERKEWTSSIVCKMLRNIVYLGHMAQGKTNKVSFKSKITLVKPKDEWYLVKNTHDPLITQETFDNVRNRSVARKNDHNKGFRNIFSGIAKCMDCGRNMSTTGTRKKEAIANLTCGGYKLYGSKECSNHFIDYQTLYDVVLKDIQSQICLTEEDKLEILESLEHEQREDNEELEIKRTIEDLNSKAREFDIIIQRLYEDNMSGKINDDRFKRLLDTYENQQKDITSRIEMLSRMTEPTPEKKAYQDFFLLLKDITEVKELTTDLLHKLIDYIEIGQGYFEDVDSHKIKHQSIKIHYKFIGSIQKHRIA